MYIYIIYICLCIIYLYIYKQVKADHDMAMKYLQDDLTAKRERQQHDIKAKLEKKKVNFTFYLFK